MGADEAGTRAPELAVARTITEAAYAGERIISAARILVCLGMGVRSAWWWAGTSLGGGHEVARAWCEFPALAVLVLFSVAVLGGLGRRRHTYLVLHVSVALDAVMLFFGLLPNVLWPADDYGGLPRMLDTAMLPILAIAAGLRLSTGAAVLGGALHGLSYAGLVLIDRAVSGDSISADAGDYTMYAVLLATAVGLALIIAVRTRRLAESGARAAVAAVRAGQGLHTLLRDHHDLRTVVSSAQINADLLARGATGDALAEVVGHLREDLGELRAQLDAVKGRALEELAGLEEARPAAADVAAAAVAVALASRFPDIDVRVAAGGAPAAMVAGGEATLRRILANLVVNACEGDGRRGARRVEISARPGDGARVVIEIVDDGPGLPAHVLAAAPGTAGSTKPAGLGLGLGLVHGLVKASGGTVAWHNRDGGGARVTVELPAIR